MALFSRFCYANSTTLVCFSMEGFKHMRDGSNVSLIDHVLAAIAEHPDAEVLVGTDSHNRSDRTIYATTVVMRYRKNGAHVVYRKEKAERIPDMWTRLWGEVERSIDVARWLTEVGNVKVHRIDLDLNSDPMHGSHKLLSAAVGYVRSFGYEARTKPDLMIASWAANALCNGYGRTHETPTGLSPRQG